MSEDQAEYKYKDFRFKCIAEKELYNDNESLDLIEYLERMKLIEDEFHSIEKKENRVYRIKIVYHYGSYLVKLYEYEGVK